MKPPDVARNDMCEVPLFRLHELRDAEDKVEALAVELEQTKIEAWINEQEIKGLLATLKLIAETPESRDTIQVWAWQAYKESGGDA